MTQEDKIDYEQKYKDAFERAKNCHIDGLALHQPVKAVIEHIFPELKEIEDKRMWELIKKYAHSNISYMVLNADHITRDQLESWLEKQGEQNPDINDDVLLRFAFYQYDDDTLYLSSVFVEECNRKRGYGSKILKAAEDVAKTFGISKIRLKVETNSWMEEWYKRNGYEYLTSEGKYDWLEKQCEQKVNMIQWKGDNLKEVIEFTGKSPKFGEWFKTWEEYENYVHSHGNIFKLFCEDGSHYEVPVGSWIVKTPDGYNIPSRFRFIQKST